MTARRKARRVALAVATRPPLRWVFERALGERAVVFMLHRFQHPDFGIAGHDPVAVRRTLGELRRLRYDLLDIGELARRLQTPGAPLARAVAFTIDDGYCDQAQVGAPAFAEFDCPVTTFVTTGFLDGERWFWWDRIEYILQQAKRAAFELALDEVRLSLDLSAPPAARRTQDRFTQWCKGVPDRMKELAIHALAEAAEVEVPCNPPAQYAPMSWDQLRTCEERGMTFGPHTVTHPVLSKTPDAQARNEIADSWNRLQQEARHPLPVFCYPNGQPGDFGEREFQILRELRFTGAVVGTPGYLDRSSIARADGMFALDRFSWSDARADVFQCIVGVEWARTVLREKTS